MTSKQSANTWPYPRHRPFVESVRKAAAAWFKKQDYPVDPKYPYILADWKDWPKNIIDKNVSQFIQERAIAQRQGGNNFPLHKYIHHGLSSQAMLFNLIGPLLVQGDLSLIQNLVEKKGLQWPGAGAQALLEYEDRSVFHELRGQPTSIDLAIAPQVGRPRIFIEAKFVEQEFGGCSVFENGDCDGRNPAEKPELCYLHHIGRKYWTMMHKHGLVVHGAIGTDALCVMAPHYQFFRELLFALEHDGIFILLSDERSPVFQSGPQAERGLMPLLLGLLPSKLHHKVALVSIQELVTEISAYQKHDWIHVFIEKYGLSKGT